MERSNNTIFAIYINVAIVTMFFLYSWQFLHWFVIPIMLCGIVVTKDALDWFTGKLEILDPVGLIGVFGVHFFVLAPFLHIAWDYQMNFISPLDDWRPWLGGMAILNFLGLLLYQYSLYSIRQMNIRKTRWTIDIRVFALLSGISFILLIGLQVYIFYTFGGFSGLMSAYQNKAEAFRGWGWVFTFSESLPTLLFIAFIYYIHRQKLRTSLISVLSILVVFFIVKMVLGGWRGSRSNTVWGILWAGALIHLWVRPISKNFLFCSAILLFAFMYFYGFYKSLGTDVFELLDSPYTLTELEKKSHRGIESLLISDLGRADVQGYMLKRLMENDSDYEYAWGQTYFSGLLSIVPRFILPEGKKPPGKKKHGTNLLYGKYSYHHSFASSKVYGLTGEAMLNFGPFVVPIYFVFFAIIVGMLQKFLMTWDIDDARFLVFPLFIIFCFTFLTADLENNLVFIIKQGLVPIVIIVLSSKRQIYL